MATSNPPPDSVEAVRIHFVREPPYNKEWLMKLKGKDYDVQYVLQIDRPKLKKVLDTTKSEKVEVDKDDKKVSQNDKEDINLIGKIKKETNMEPEIILEKTQKFLKLFPDFTSKSEKEKTLIIADMINGKFDDVLFGNKDIDEPNQKINSKPIQAYKQAEKT